MLPQPQIASRKFRNILQWHLIAERRVTISKGTNIERRFACGLREPPMQKHKFAKGDMVIVQPDTATSNMRPGCYLILQQLPIANSEAQYRVKGLLDPCERIVSERWLRPTTKS